jgi:endo-1,4-beta-xylanase
MNKAAAVAFANIAFVEYWGHADALRDIPAHPSISMNLDCLSTVPTVASAEGPANVHCLLVILLLALLLVGCASPVPGTPTAELLMRDSSVQTGRGQENMVQVETPSDMDISAPSTSSLRELAQVRGIHIGAAVAPGPLRREAPYAQALAHEFSMLTTENALKFGPVHPSLDRYAFDDADDIIVFAEANDMLVRGHTLVWHNQLPSWIEQGEWTREELMTVLEDHISTVVRRYRGRVHAWDVVNEAIDKGSLRDTVWLRTIGPEYLDLAFRWAHEADPGALLFYNDYGGEGINRKSDAIYDLVEGMLERGVPIHGVGLQMHVTASWSPGAVRVLDNMNRLADLGLQVHITELDVRIRGGPSEHDLQRQADIYRETMETCLAARSCTAYVTWGFADRHSWIPGFFSGWGSALIFDETYQPKPAYTALHETLATP